MAFKSRFRNRGYRSNYKFKKKQAGMQILGKLLGLVFGLWVFDGVLKVVIPLVQSCSGNGTWSNATTCCVAGTNCAIGVNGSAVTIGFFGTTIVFIQSIIPVVGIIAGYHLIKPLFYQM